MSRFFNQSRKQVHHANSEDATVDVQERVARLKSSIEAEPPSPVEIDDSELKQVLGPLNGLAQDAPILAAARLENCRKIDIPRDQHKSLLATQYSISLQHAVEAYRTLRTRVVKRQEQTGMRSMVVSSAGQGEGKTLTTFNLALCFARIQDWPVLLVDADLRTRGMSRLFGDPHSAGLAKILETGAAYESAIFRTDVPNLYALPAGESELPAPELFSRAALKEFISWSSEAFKLVLIDAPPILHLADFELIEAACEGVMLVVRLGTTNQDSLAKTHAHVAPEKLVGLVLNDSPEGAGSSYYRYLTANSAK